MTSTSAEAASRDRNCYDEISRAITTLVFDEPFYGHLLAGMNRRVTTQTATAAVSVHAGRPLLVVNPDFFLDQTTRKQQRVAVIKHEALHLLLRHVFRSDLASKNHTVFNLAADLVVNQLIGTEWELLDGAITLDTFAPIHLLPDQTVDWYYDRLIEHRIARMKLAGSGGPDGAGVDDGGTRPGEAYAGQSDADEAGASEDKSEGSGSGDAGSGQRGGSSRDDLTEQEQQLVAIDALLGGFGEAHGYHQCGGWDVSDQFDASIAERELGRLALAARQRGQARAWGLLPGMVRASVEELIADLEPTVDWRRTMRIFQNSARRTRIKNTMRRPSKRYGTFPGTKVRPNQDLVVAVDTSGSISNDDLADFFAEVKGIWRQGADLTVVECDQAVQHVWQYTGGGPPEVVHGRTGTAFDPVFAWVRDRGRRPDGVIYLTDGYARTPELNPGCPVLWVITPDGDAENLGFGRTCKIARTN